MSDKKIFNWKQVSLFRNELFGLSIISIIIFHYFEDVRLYVPAGALSNIASAYSISIGSIGVEIFLFLSGMGLYFSYRKNSNILSFYKKRSQRLFVPYLIIGGIFWFVRDIIIFKYSVFHFLYDFSTLSFWGRGQGNIWFVSFIAVMYLLFPIIYQILNRKSGIAKFFAFICIMIAWAMMISILIFKFKWIFDNTETALWRIPIFVFGVYMGERIYNEENINLFDFLIVISGFLIKFVLIILHIAEFSFAKSLMLSRAVNELFAITAVILATLLIGVLGAKIKIFLTHVGALSLELYVSHVCVRAIMINIGILTWKWYNYFICIAISVIVSIAIHMLSGKINKQQLNHKP